MLCSLKLVPCVLPLANQSKSRAAFVDAHCNPDCLRLAVNQAVADQTVVGKRVDVWSNPLEAMRGLKRGDVTAIR